MSRPILISCLLSGLLTYYAQNQQFFPDIPPVFPSFTPDRNLLNFFLVSLIFLMILIYFSGELTLILSGLLAYCAQTQHFFPDFFPDFIPNRNLLNVFLFFWVSLAILRFICVRCFRCSFRDSSRNSRENYNPIIDYYNDDVDYYELFNSRNNIAHRADAFNPFSRRFNQSSRHGSNGRTARWSHKRASRNNQFVRNYGGLPYFNNS